MPSQAEWVRQRASEAALRKVAGLEPGQGLYPSQKPFATQAEALEWRQGLIDRGEYTPPQLGLFAQEIGEGGKRQFMVGTYAGFAKEHAPEFVPHTGAFQQELSGRAEKGVVKPGKNLYEIIMEKSPCWLYFDLEYQREQNADLSPDAAMAAFRATLADFCAEAIGSPLDESSIIEMDSSTPKKFSKHVIVQRLCGTSGDALGQRQLVFANNAQAGLFVSEFLAFAIARRDRRDSQARHLFVMAPPTAREGDTQMREVSMVDESVYSRNRSFRLLFHAKFGKSATLSLPRDSIKRSYERSEYPPLKLLRTMASFVPDGIPYFSHALIPPDYQHQASKVARVLPGGRPRESRESSCGVARSNVQQQQSGLLQYLIEQWDRVRKQNEPPGKAAAWHPATRVQSAAEMADGRFLSVTLDNNRFCFCKGSSHVSNHVYVVVDLQQGVFHQKCHDIDCRHFKSPPFEIPAWLMEEEAEAFRSPERQGAKRPLDELSPEPPPCPEKRACVAAVVKPEPVKPEPVPWPQPTKPVYVPLAAPPPDSDEEIGADPDELEAARAGQKVAVAEEDGDWFDVDRLW